MAAAKRLRDIAREAKALNAALGSLDEEAKRLKQVVDDGMTNELLSESFKVPGGGGIHLERMLWAGPADKDHAALTAVLDELGLDEYKPSKVNSQSLSAFIREHLDPARIRDGRVLTIEERLLSEDPKPLDPKLLAALKVSEKRTVKVTGV